MPRLTIMSTLSQWRDQVLKVHCVSDAQLGEGSCLLVIMSLYLGSSGDSSTVADLFGLPVLEEGLRMSKDAGAKGVAIQILRRGWFCEVGIIARLHQAPGQLFYVSVA